MQEVEACVRFQVLEQAVGTLRHNVIPAHVRQMGLVHHVRVVEAFDVGIDPAEAGQAALVAARGEHLHADADADDVAVFALHQLVQAFAHTRFLQARHRPIEGAYAWQDDFFRTAQLGSVGGDRNRNAEALVDVGDGQYITQAIVDDGDHRLPPSSRPRNFMTLAPNR
ncbi:hypothetical protein D3C81_1388070 [compost metagenome]